MVDDVSVYQLAVPEHADATRVGDIFITLFFTRRLPSRTTCVSTILNVDGPDPSSEALHTAYNT